MMSNRTLAQRLEPVFELAFSVLLAGLVLLFWLTLLGPGNAYTSWIFSLLAPVQDFLAWGYQEYVGKPVIWCCEWLVKYMPSSLLSFFPVTTVQTLVTAFLDLFKSVHGFYEHPATRAIYGYHYADWFPGVIDWRIPMTIWLWRFLEQRVNTALAWLARTETSLRFRSGMKTAGAK